MNKTRTYKTAWSLADKTSIDKSIFEIIQTSMEKGNATRNRELFFQYVALLFVAGKRRIEPFLKPVTIKKEIDQNGRTWYHVTSMVAKHFTNGEMECKVCNEAYKTRKAQKEHRQQTGHKLKHTADRIAKSHYWPIQNEYDKALFEYLLRGRQVVSIDFTPLLSAKDRNISTSKMAEGNLHLNAITMKFMKTFTKQQITNGKIQLEGYILPHMLRHLRAYDLMITHRRSPLWVQRMMDWDTEEMPYYYVDIKDMMDALEEKRMIEEEDRWRK